MSKQNKYVKIFNFTGICEVDVELLSKDWHSGFHISVINKPNISEYFITKLNRRTKARLLKVMVSEEQALKIAENCDLVKVKVFGSSFSYCSKDTIENSLKYYKDKLYKIEEEAQYLKHTIHNLEKSLK